jgi:hypothetical protein
MTAIDRDRSGWDDRCIEHNALMMSIGPIPNKTKRRDVDEMRTMVSACQFNEPEAPQFDGWPTGGDDKAWKSRPGRG